MTKFKRIAIDAGHGGKDPGAVNSSLKIEEADVALKIAKRFKKLFSPRVKKLMIRDGDYFVELNSRWKKANTWNADVCVCIHLNSAEAKSVRGTEVYYNDPGTEKKLAINIVKRISKALKISNRGAIKHDWAMTKYPNCPAVLVEVDFISNDTFARKTRKRSYIRKIAKAIYKGVRDTK